MMRKTILTIVIILGYLVNIYADEGMWIPMFLNKYNIEELVYNGEHMSDNALNVTVGNAVTSIS